MKNAVFVVIALVLAGCASKPPTVQSGPDAEVSYDGLHLVDNSVFKPAWADPDADWARYSKLIPGGGVYEFRAVKEGQQYLPCEVERFTATDTRGADTLIIRGALHDIVSNVPPERAGRSEVFLDSVGEATLIIEALDSLSGEVIFRAVERCAAAPSTGAYVQTALPHGPKFGG